VLVYKIQLFIVHGALTNINRLAQTFDFKKLLVMLKLTLRLINAVEILNMYNTNELTNEL